MVTRTFNLTKKREEGRGRLPLTVFKTVVWYIIYNNVKIEFYISKKNQELIECFIDQTGWLYPAVTDLNKLKTTVSSFSLEVIGVAGFGMNLKPINYLHTYAV